MMVERYESFNQPAPTLGKQYDDDRGLRSYLRRALPPEMLAAVEDELRAMGKLAGGKRYRLTGGRAQGMPPAPGTCGTIRSCFRRMTV